MTREPDWSALPADTPANVRRLLDRCLRRDLKTRLRDIGEALVLLDEPEASAPTPSALRARLAWILAAAFALSTLAMAVLWLRTKPSDPGPGVARFQIPLVPGTTWPANNNATQWAPSPDGNNLAMIAADSSTGKNALWVRPLGSASAHRLDKTEGANFPFWSPDGHSIGFFAENKLKRVALSGGSVQIVCDVASGADGGSWGEDGTILFAAVNGPLMRVNATGGNPRPASVLAEGETWHSWPPFLPDGRHVLYLAENKETRKQRDLCSGTGFDQAGSRPQQPDARRVVAARIPALRPRGHPVRAAHGRQDIPGGRRGAGRRTGCGHQ
jgi:hypothetical protein